MRSVVFVTADIGYWFCIDSDGTFGYRKTTDGGASWGSEVVISSATTHLAFDVWFDQWTPGDSGTLIHTWYFDSTNDDVRWRTLDTSGDTLGTQRTVFNGSTAVAGRGVFVSGAKMRSGYLYCAYDIDAGAERGLHRSTDSGTTWSANLSTTFVEATIDQCILFPASNTGDNNDCWAIYDDDSAGAVTLKMWDSSAGSAVESATIHAVVENTTDLTGQYGISASVRHSDGHLILASLFSRDFSDSDHLVFDINGTGSITAKTAITTNIDDHFYPAVFIDQTTDDIYVAFNGLRTGTESLGSATKVYYTKSTDGGATWSAGSTAYQEGATAAVVQVWAPLMGLRFYVGWRVGATLVGNKVNSVTFSAGVTGTGSEAVALSLAGTGKQQHTSTGTAALLFALAGVGSVSAGFGGAGGIGIGMELSGTGQQQHTGTGAIPMEFGLGGTAGQQHTGSGGQTISWGLAGTAQHTHTGTGTLAVAFSKAGTGQQRHTGTGSQAISWSFAGAGTVTAPGGSFAGTGTIAVSFGLAGSGQPSHTGTGGLTVAWGVSGDGSPVHEGTGSMAVVLTVHGDNPGNGALTIALGLSGTGQQQHTGRGITTTTFDSQVARWDNTTVTFDGSDGNDRHMDFAWSVAGMGTVTEPEVGTLSPGGASSYSRGRRLAYQWREDEQPVVVATPLPGVPEPRQIPTPAQFIGKPGTTTAPPEVLPWEPATPIAPALEPIAPYLELPPPPENNDDEEAITMLLHVL